MLRFRLTLINKQKVFFLYWITQSVARFFSSHFDRFQTIFLYCFVFLYIHNTGLKSVPDEWLTYCLMQWTFKLITQVNEVSTFWQRISQKRYKIICIYFIWNQGLLSSYFHTKCIPFLRSALCYPKQKKCILESNAFI